MGRTTRDPPPECVDPIVKLAVIPAGMRLTRLACIVRRLIPMASSEDLLWHTLDAGSAVEQLATDPERGLGEATVHSRTGRFRPNELPAARQRPLWPGFLSQFRSPRAEIQHAR
jgi:magnesium-transporting ATPase (P-type)